MGFNITLYKAIGITAFPIFDTLAESDIFACYLPGFSPKKLRIFTEFIELFWILNKKIRPL